MNPPYEWPSRANFSAPVYTCGYTDAVDDVGVLGDRDRGRHGPAAAQRLQRRRGRTGLPLDLAVRRLLDLAAEHQRRGQEAERDTERDPDQQRTDQETAEHRQRDDAEEDPGEHQPDRRVGLLGQLVRRDDLLEPAGLLFGRVVLGHLYLSWFFIRDSTA